MKLTLVLFFWKWLFFIESSPKVFKLSSCEVKKIPRGCECFLSFYFSLKEDTEFERIREFSWIWCWLNRSLPRCNWSPAFGRTNTLGVHQFKQTEMCPAEGGVFRWGMGWGDQNAVHLAESEIPWESPLPVTAATAPWACFQPTASLRMLHLKVQFLDDSQKIFVVDVSGNYIAIIPLLFIQ